MESLSFDLAWQTYRTVQPRYPAPPAPVAPRRVAGIVEAVAESGAQVVLLDAYGVLHSGGEGFPWAREAFAALRAGGTRIAVLTNDASGDKPAICARNASRGFVLRPEEIVAGVDLLPALLETLTGDWGVCGSWGNPFPELMAGLTELGVDPEPWHGVDGIILLDTDTWTPRKQHNLARSLQRRPRPLVVCNPDVVCPSGGGSLAAEPGFYVHRAAPDGEVIQLGKPFPGVYEKAASLFPEVPRTRFLAAGDTLHTDVLGARAAGMKALMVETGFTAGRDPEPLFADSGIWPDYLADRL